MTTFALGLGGGLVSFLSTALGVSLVVFGRNARGGATPFRLPIDFALGVMLAASAFSLVGPAAMGAASLGGLFSIVVATAFGAAAVCGMKRWVLARMGPADSRVSGNQARLTLAIVLMLHNLPEGLASGAAVAGLGWKHSWGILCAIALQNVPEGALMVGCLSAIGWSFRAAVWGGIASAGVELLGGLLSGLLLGWTQFALPFLLAIAGGAMISSVFIELLETEEAWKRLFSPSFRAGFVALSFFQLLQSWG